jgi:hypothetical protein
MFGYGLCTDARWAPRFVRMAHLRRVSAPFFQGWRLMNENTYPVAICPDCRRTPPVAARLRGEGAHVLMNGVPDAAFPTIRAVS